MPNGVRFEIVVMGDSIQWGQGLTEPQKFSELVRQTIERERRQETVLVHRFARSGAVLGAPNDGWPAGDPPNFDPGTFAGELPGVAPTVHAQINQAVPPDTTNLHVNLLLVDGGINDIGIETIINPFTDDADLRARVQTACRARMLQLLRTLADRYPNARVVVTGYYPIFSGLSSVLFAVAWLQGLVIPIPFDLLIGQALILRLAQLSELWAEASQLALRDAVNTINNALPGPHRVVYAHVTFGPENCLFAPMPWLFGLTPVLTPEDPVVAERVRLCAATPDRARNPICHWASVGHPNAIGSWQYARAIIRALRELGVLGRGNVLDRICNWAQEREFRCLQWRENQRTQCAAVEVAEIAQCNAAHAQRLTACNAIQCNAFANCGQIQCNAFANCGQIQCNAFANCAWWDVPCHVARGVCVAAAAVAQAACWAARGICVAAAAVAQAACWAARGICVAAAAVARAACIAGSAVILAACIAAARTRRAACVIGTEIVSRSCTAFTWLVTRFACW